MKPAILASAFIATAAAAPSSLKRETPGAKQGTNSIYAYSQVVDGLDAAVDASDFLTWHELSGYDISSCRNYCSTDPGGCNSFNIYREFGAASSSEPLYKCSLYSQKHTVVDATNKGGQDLGYGQLTRIEWSQIQSKGGQYSVTALTGAILASASGGYLTNSDIGWSYDPASCADACDKTDGCAYANLWQGWSQVNGNTKPTCSLFSGDAQISGTDTNLGDGNIYVTDSNLYSRDGVF